ncbi:MAG: ABC transporter substrate-binding protein, partial [Desulfobulbales bacterium]|nr:ABC transporter substrate-binding protein [Desulfobulbales bacterium]
MMGKNVFQQERFKVVLLLLLLVIFGAKGSALSKDGPMDQLQRSVDEILKILQSAELKVPEKNAERKQLILSVVTEMFDFQEMAKSSLGKNWSSISTAEQDKFVDLFTRLVEQRYIGKIDAYNNQKVVYKKERVQGNKAIIYTDIVDKDLEIPIDYRLKEKQGKWLIYDLKIENVSLVANYRRDFDSIM